ncbi:major capsid protein [Phascolarctid gammaherpesvirus 1]|uniref:Major capsid protein n=1 Tax=Phascolarctid gammaherpesvirus 1 TaxID=2249313 RepID=A0A3Q8J4G8_9GAMA|nr:major capsid protein [Phascolarctid gammaherpesvirus 1]AZB49197.1 major capsid protein [Phascolarctid gammaherpesvirus 1]
MAHARDTTQQCLLENRPIPYSLVEADLLTGLKQSAAAGLFRSFQLYTGKDVRDETVKFEMLLGVYTNSIEFVKFLETSLAVSCINTEFKDLKRMVDGKIQFKVSVPTIAYNDGRPPSKQRMYIVMKTCSKHHIGAEMELNMEDLEILNSIPTTELEEYEYVGAIKTVTSAMKFCVDALERGLINTVLSTKLRQAPPMFILKPLTNTALLEHGFKSATKANIIAACRRDLLEQSFFLDRAMASMNPKAHLIASLTDIVGVVSSETVFKGISTYTTESGESIEGVIETTDGVMRQLLNVFGQKGKAMLGPAAYANYVIKGENLVTAVSYGRAMYSFDHFKERILDSQNHQLDRPEDMSTWVGGNKTSIGTSLIQVGSNMICVESLQHMYTQAQACFPLHRRLQYSYFFPVGLHLTQPKYTTSNSVKGLEAPTRLPTETWVVNKNNIPQKFSFLEALKMLCHPRVHNPVPCATALQRGFPHPLCGPNYYGKRHIPSNTMNLYQIVTQYYLDKRHVELTDISRKATMSRDELLHPTNHDVLYLEVHPFFDFFTDNSAGPEATYRATHRTMAGNIPGGLAPGSMHECRGWQFAKATDLEHSLCDSTLARLRDTASDVTYPILCYVVEAMIHGQEDKFIINMDLVALIVTTYWNSTGNLAFSNSYFMVKHICLHLGRGLMRKEIYLHYKNLYNEVQVLYRALIQTIGNEVVEGLDIGAMVSAILDPTLLPPFTYRDIFTPLLRDASEREARVLIGPSKYMDPKTRDEHIKIRGKMDDLVDDMLNIYTERVNEDHDHNYQLFLGPETSSDDAIMEKIFYYLLLPVYSGGRVCGAGIEFENLSIMLTYNGPIFSNTYPDTDSILDHLENGTLRDLLLSSDIRPTIRMMKNLCTSFLTCPPMTQTARVKCHRDSCQVQATHEEGKSIEHTVLVNGLATFHVSVGNRSICEKFMYPIPFHPMYSHPTVAATLHETISEYLMRVPTQKGLAGFNVPPELVAEYREWHKTPLAIYPLTCPASTVSIDAMIAMHMKLSPISFIQHTLQDVHPGFALTCVRTDEVLGEYLMYSSRASSSVFIGQPSVTRNEVKNDSVTFEVTHEIGTLENGLGYSSTLTPARVVAITTDMGTHAQDMFTTHPTDRYGDKNIMQYIRSKIGTDKTRLTPRDPRTYITGAVTVTQNGLGHGQLSTCESIITPSNADIGYFQGTNNPRGRASCVVSCEPGNLEASEKLVYDHSLPDTNYEHRSTINPWASQLGSLGDILYNSHYRHVSVPGIYSPCRQFFSRDDIMRNNKVLYSLINEYTTRLLGNPATSSSDIQYTVINGTDVFLEQPCLMLQEAFPTISTSHRALLEEYMSNSRSHAPVHMGDYLIEEVAPVNRVLKIGNKVAH